LLESSTALLQTFIPKGKLLVQTKSNTRELAQKYFSEGPGIETLPIVVLINENSASASEIFAGAIQDYERGIVVGSKSHGKGSVQITYPLKNDGELKITVARWYTPKERGIDGVGIQPDIESIVQASDFEKQYDIQILHFYGTIGSNAATHLLRCKTYVINGERLIDWIDTGCGTSYKYGGLNLKNQLESKHVNCVKCLKRLTDEVSMTETGIRARLNH
jgi:hypothetical protein